MSIIGIISNTVLFIVAILANIAWRKEINYSDEQSKKLLEQSKIIKEKEFKIEELKQQMTDMRIPESCKKGEWCKKCQHSYTLIDGRYGEYGCDLTVPCEEYER